LLFHERQDQDGPVRSKEHLHLHVGIVVALRVGNLRCRGQALMLINIVVQGDADLLQIVPALRLRRGLAHLLHGRHQQRDQHGDDGDHHQQLDQGESVSPRHEIALRKGAFTKARIC
jgi:hypothetical protein